jgi:hypothetical protein
MLFKNLHRLPILHSQWSYLFALSLLLYVEILLGLCLICYVFYRLYSLFREDTSAYSKIYFHTTCCHMQVKLLINFFYVENNFFLSRLNAWRDNEKEIIASRMQMQLDVRRLVQLLGPKTGDNFMNQMESCVPSVVCNADSNRIRRKLGKYNKTYV